MKITKIKNGYIKCSKCGLLYPIMDAFRPSKCPNCQTNNPELLDFSNTLIHIINWVIF